MMHTRGVGSCTDHFYILLQNKVHYWVKLKHQHHISQAQQVHVHLLHPQSQKKSHTSNTRHKQQTSSKRGPFLLLASNRNTRGIPWNHTPPSMIHIHTQPESCQCGALLYNVETQRHSYSGDSLSCANRRSQATPATLCLFVNQLD